MGRSTVREKYPLISDVFKNSGYTTGLFGKWHIGYNWPHRPMDRGFDEAIYFNGYGLTGMGHYWNCDYYDPYYHHNDELKQAKDWYCNDFWFSEAIEWMNKCNEENNPFFCYLATNLPHFPNWIDTTYSNPYNESGAAGFYGMIANLDENMGKLVKFLDDSKLRENTILIFLTDNGTVNAKVYNAGMTGGKCTRTEGGHRVPCFISWPDGNLSKPSNINTPTQVQDLFPTLIDLCGLESPENNNLNGVSLAGLLKGKPIQDRMFVVQYQQNDLQKYDAAVVWNQWRLLPFYGDNLYDISTDLAQKNNVAAEHPEIVRKMKNFYEEWWAEVEPGINHFTSNHIGSLHQSEVILNSSDWEEVRADGNNNVRLAQHRPKAGAQFTGGLWNIQVSKAGEYAFELRRYPREADAAICAAIPEFQPKFGKPAPPGISLDVTKAVLETENDSYSRAVSETDKSVVFKVELPEGKTKIKTWFSDESDSVVCGSYYTYVKLVE